MSDSDNRVTRKKQKIDDDDSAGCSEMFSQSLPQETQSTTLIQSTQIKQEVGDYNITYVLELEKIDAKDGQDWFTKARQANAERNRLYRERRREEINRRRRENWHRKKKSQQILDLSNNGTNETEQMTHETSTKQQSSNLRAQRQQRYYERNKEEINQRKRESRLQQSQHTIPATPAERNRIYRERNKQKINERRRKSRLLQRYSQQIQQKTMKCCVLSCKNYSDRRSDAMNGITFHVFPSEDNLREQWITKVNRQDWTPTKYTKICSCHFNNDDFFVTEKGLKKLKKGTLPSLKMDITSPKRKSPLSTISSPEPTTSKLNEFLILHDTPREKILTQEIQKLRWKAKKDRLKIKRLQMKVKRLQKKQLGVHYTGESDATASIGDLKTKKKEKIQIDDKFYKKRELITTLMLTESKQLDSSTQDTEEGRKDSQIPGPSHGNPPLVLRKQQTAQDSEIAGSSTNISNLVDDGSENKNRIGVNVLAINEENRGELGDNLMPIQDQVCALLTLKQINRSSAIYSTYVKHSSAHIQFLKQFIQNEFGYACQICDRLWFKGELKNLKNNSVEFVRTFLPNVDERSLAVCITCRTSIHKKSIPKMAVFNGFEYPPLPDNLRNLPLDLVSERLVSPRIPFMQIRSLRRVHGQQGMYGQVINVPVEVNTMVDKLPRRINDDLCINVQIERKKIHKSNFIHGQVNKHTIKEWVEYLVNTPLYKSYNITIDEEFFDNYDKELLVDGSNEDEDNLEDISIEESLLAQQQTAMWNDDLYLRIAAGKNVPMSLIFDKYTEELSFPSIYLGHFRKFREGVVVTPFLMANSELRRSDRRGVAPQHLLYLAMKIMILRIKDSLSFAFKHIGKKINITKEEIQSEDYIYNCTESNLAFLRSIPNSTWYWSERKKDLFAMIRQFGKPTVFFTISANEIGWLDLLQLLYKLKTRVHITKEEISKLHYMVKSTLVNEDAVTCAIYFNKLVNVVMSILQSKVCSPFGKYRVLHSFKRIDFKHRGSPQAHILAWLDNAPKYALTADYDEAIKLIDTLMSVSVAEASGNIKLQTHEHTFTCYKKNITEKEQKCRFDAPFMPCKKTMILTPMKNIADGFIDYYQQRYAEIRVRLENEDFEDMDNFYKCNGINSDEDYYNILRAGITRPKVFLKREPSEKWHNSFNPFILNIVQSSTDFQFITEEYSCATYVVDYVNKTTRVSHLQRAIIDTINENPELDIIDITKNISVNVLKHTNEMTSQEAAWYLLREPLSKSSVNIVYIPTVWPVERQRVRRSMKESEEDSTDVWKENWFDKYEKRPKSLENITLAQFVSKYTQNGGKEYIERREPKIIRYRTYDMTFDFNEYKREMVTLHLPFRNELEDILAELKFITIYDDNEDIITQRRREFESDTDIDKITQMCRELCLENALNEDRGHGVVNCEDASIDNEDILTEDKEVQVKYEMEDKSTMTEKNYLLKRKKINKYYTIC